MTSAKLRLMGVLDLKGEACRSQKNLPDAGSTYLAPHAIM